VLRTSARLGAFVEPQAGLPRVLRARLETGATDEEAHANACCGPAAGTTTVKQYLGDGSHGRLALQRAVVSATKRPRLRQPRSSRQRGGLLASQHARRGPVGRLGRAAWGPAAARTTARCRIGHQLSVEHSS